MGAGRSESTGVPAAGTYTFLFTDVEGSTRRWQADADGMASSLTVHDRILRAAVADEGGRVFKHTGDGICAVFTSPAAAVRAAVEAQRNVPLPVRMAIHTGEALEREDDYFGVALSRCARLMDAGHGGQILASAGAASAAGDALLRDVEFRDLGEHRLKDLSRSERIFQVVARDTAQDFAPLRSLDAVRHNLPVQRSSFVGREVEVGEVRYRVLEHPLVTLTGIGGCGKTRLALETAARVVESFGHGVFFVDLAVVPDTALLAQAVSSALGLQLLDPDAEGLAGHLRGRRALIVLDNCEHLLDACAALVETLLDRCPELHILATSRETLAVDGEHAFRVPSLAVHSDAVSLFVDRAHAVRPELQLDDETARVIAEICGRLDGIPLAIELAAARAAHLSPAEILDRLSDRFALLTGGRRKVQRQQTLAAAIDWSYALLSEHEQVLLRRLAVFRGSFSLRAAEDICHPDALNLLGSLVLKSLLNLAGEQGLTRYRLLETVRLYAEERLVEAGEADRLRCLHRDWFLDWIESIPPGELPETPPGSPLVFEADNLSAALDWSLEQNRIDLVARIASRMIGYWWGYLRIADLTAWWEELEGSVDALPLELRGAALIVGVQRAMVIGDFDEMEALSARAVVEAPPDSWVEAYAWSMQALYWTYADPQRGLLCIEEGLRVAAAAGTPEIEAMTAIRFTNLITGDHAHDDALGVREVIDRLLSLGESSTVGTFLPGILALLGESDRAADLMACLPTVRLPVHEFVRVVSAVAIAEGGGDAVAMMRQLERLHTLVREYAIPLGEVSCLVGFASLAVLEGDHERASLLLATARGAASFPFRTPLEVLMYRRCSRAVRAALDPETARRCRDAGAAITVDAAIEAELARRRSPVAAPTD